MGERLEAELEAEGGQNLGIFNLGKVKKGEGYMNVDAVLCPCTSRRGRTEAIQCFGLKGSWCV